VQPYGEAYRLGGDEFCAVVSIIPRELEAFLAASAAALRESGEGFAVESSYGAVALPHEAGSTSRALEVADQRMYARKQGRSLALMRALHAHRPGAQAELARAVAARLGMGPEERDEVARAAELHDLGKAGVPATILEKPQKLTDVEWEYMRQHPVAGERILSGAEAMRPVARLVRSAHEHWDGTGYPDGLAGEAIPLGARVVAVCAAFAAMTADRAYRPRLDPAGALRELRRAAGRQFDPTVVEAFLAELSERGRRAEGEEPDDRSAYVREVAGRLRDVLDQEGVSA
jgi:HD-GYP domain-containing protein (c-di-GMP phosphodiesterase class II)